MLEIYNTSAFYELLQQSDLFIQTRLSILFPIGHKTRLTKELQTKIEQAVSRVLLLFGYTILPEQNTVIQIKHLHREENNTVVGLFNPSIYPRISQMFKFLNLFEQKRLINLTFLSIAKSMMKSQDITEIVHRSNQYPFWISLHPILNSYPILHDISNVQYALEKSLNEEDEDDEENENNSVVPRSVFRGLNYTNNSCYIDSTLVALFAVPNGITKFLLNKNVDSLEGKWIECGSSSNREKIQKELSRIASSIQGGSEVSDCSYFRDLLSTCRGSQPFHQNGMNDAGEFLHFLFNIFEVEVMTKIRKTYGTNDVKSDYEVAIQSHEEKQLCTPIIDVDLTLSNDLNYFLSQTDDAVLEHGYSYKGQFYRRRIETTKVLSTPYIVFNLRRLTLDRTGRYNLNTTVVDFPDDIVVRSKRLKLQAVIVYEAMHYTTFVYYQKQWYHYNDLPRSTIRPIHENIQSILARNGVMYFYG